MKRFSLATFPLEGKTVFLRVDYNVPFEKGKIVDNSKIKLSYKNYVYSNTNIQSKKYFKNITL